MNFYCIILVSCVAMSVLQNDSVHLNSACGKALLWWLSIC